jgi:hypothetical protein
MSSARRSRRAIVGGAACLAFLTMSTVVPQTQATVIPYLHPPLLFGTSAPSEANLVAQEQVAGRELVAVREYRLWNSPMIGPDQIWMRDTFHTLFLSIKARRTDGSVVPYADIAAAVPGTPVYQDMLNIAAQLKAYNTRIFLTFNHEPETSAANGTPAQFAAAFRTFVTVMRAQGVNAAFVAIFTGFGFTRTDSLNVDNFYPGDAYVDDVGVDVYNWASCRNQPWKDLSTLIESARVWGLAHPKEHLILTEWGTVEDPSVPGRKATWISDVASLLTQPAYAQFAGVISWGAGGTASQCPFDYSTSTSSTAAWQAMGHEQAYSAGE